MSGRVHMRPWTSPTLVEQPCRAIGEVLEPDQVMPAQFFSPQSRRLGAGARLFQAIVDDALKALSKSGTRAEQRERWAALVWFADVYGTRAPCNFAAAIDGGYVGLDAEILSEAILRRFTHLPLSRQVYLQARMSREARTRSQERVHA